MNSWKVILATIVIFGAGVITGGLLVDHVKHPPHHPGVPKPPIIDTLPQAVSPEFLKKQFVQLLNDKLNLTAQQSNQIQKIIAQGQQNTHDLWKLMQPQFQALWHDTRQQIRDVLTPEQRRQYEMLMKQQRQFRHPLGTNAPPALPAVPTNTPAV